jgi:cell migration-inducing and hyaluronan-binding protein
MVLLAESHLTIHTYPELGLAAVNLYCCRAHAHWDWESRLRALLAGTEITVTTEMPDVSLTLREMDEGSWVIFELPGFTTAASGTEQSSLDALRRASGTSYFRDQGALWVKVVSNGDGARGPIGGGSGSGTSLQVSR